MMIEIINRRNNFTKVCELDYKIAMCLNKGDIIFPNGTGFAFIVEEKYVCLEDNIYKLRINVYEWKSFQDKIKKFFK